MAFGVCHPGSARTVPVHSQNHHRCSENLIISCNSPIHPTAARGRGPGLASRSELAEESPKWGSSLEAELAIRDPCACPSQAILLHQLGKAKSSRSPLCFQRASIGLSMAVDIKKGVASLPCLRELAQSPRRGMSPRFRDERGKICWAASTKASSSTACNPARDDRRDPEAPDARSCGEHSHARRARHRVTGRVLSPHRSRRDADSSIHSHAQSGTSARKPDGPRQSRLPPQMQRQLSLAPAPPGLKPSRCLPLAVDTSKSPCRPPRCWHRIGSCATIPSYLHMIRPSVSRPRVRETLLSQAAVDSETRPSISRRPTEFPRRRVEQPHPAI